MTTGRRVHERYDLDLEIVVKHEDGTIECTSRNVSLGGMYLVTEEKLPYGTKVRLEFFLPALKKNADIEATVRFAGDEGMGVQFGGLRAREVWAFNQLFKGSPRSTV